MSSDVALRVRGLSKRYSIRHKDHDHVTLAQSALHRIRHPRGATNREDFWALRDVSFDVPRGEVLGVIGHNGAGKSTLLKVLSRITPPTDGSVEVFGRIGSLLEVGTGFHPELTGRENVYLNGSILGMKKKEIDRQFDEIVDFSGVQQFLDTPVKRYSSGMYVRLAFAVAAHLDTEILLLDEVLAVGDAEFQKKCLGKMGEVAARGRTVVLVSHDLFTMTSICGSAVLLRHGVVDKVGESNAIAELYRTLAPVAPLRFSRETRPRLGSGEARIASVQVCVPSDPREEIEVSFLLDASSHDGRTAFISCEVRNERDAVVLHGDSRLVGFGINTVSMAEQRVTIAFSNCWLPRGWYRVRLIMFDENGYIDYLDDAAVFDVDRLSPYPFPATPDALDLAPLLSQFTYRTVGGS